MDVTKLTVRLPKEVLERAKIFAREIDTTLTMLITTFLDQLPNETDPLANAPTVRRPSGSLSQDFDLEDYGRYLEEKYE